MIPAQSLGLAVERAQIANERKLEVAVPTPNLDPYIEHLKPFVGYCKAKGVRFCPAQSTTVLAFLREQKSADPALTLQFLAALQLLHEKHRQPDPVDDTLKSELWRLLSEAAADPTDPLRSWSKEEKLLFPSLPPAVQAVLKRIDDRRTREIKKLQGELAALAGIKTLRRLGDEIEELKLELAQLRATKETITNG